MGYFFENYCFKLAILAVYIITTHLATLFWNSVPQANHAAYKRICISRAKKMTRLGLEPGISGSGGRRLIH